MKRVWTSILLASAMTLVLQPPAYAHKHHQSFSKSQKKQQKASAKQLKQQEKAQKKAMKAQNKAAKKYNKQHHAMTTTG